MLKSQGLDADKRAMGRMRGWGVLAGLISALALAVIPPASAEPVDAGTGAAGNYTYSHTWDPATGLLTTDARSTDSTGRIGTGSAGTMPYGCSGCPADWSSVRRWIITTTNPTRFGLGRYQQFLRNGDELKIELHAGAVVDADIEVEFTTDGVSPVRMRATPMGFDLNADGDEDITLFAGDWRITDIEASNHDDLIDLSQARHLWGKADWGLRLKGHDGNDVLTGTYLRDEILGGNGSDVISGMGGVDRLWGEAGSNILRGGADTDFLYGSVNNDRLYGGPGGDHLVGGGGSDLLIGGTGDDGLFGGPGSDRMFGQQGNDSVVDFQGRDLANGGAGNDYLNFGTLAGRWGSHARISRAVCGQGRDRLGDNYPRRSRDCERGRYGTPL